MKTYAIAEEMKIGDWIDLRNGTGPNEITDIDFEKETISFADVCFSDDESDEYTLSSAVETLSFLKFDSKKYYRN